MATQLKQGDIVVLLAGDSKGKKARVRQVLPRKERVLLEPVGDSEADKVGINPIKRHTKKTQNTEGGVITREAPVHLSNVMKADRYEARRAKKNTTPAS